MLADEVIEGLEGYCATAPHDALAVNALRFIRFLVQEGDELRANLASQRDIIAGLKKERDEAVRLAAALQQEAAQAYEQAGSDRAELNTALLEVDRLRKELYGDPAEDELEADRRAIQRFQERIAGDLAATEERGAAAAEKRYLSAVRGRMEFRDAFRRERAEVKRLREALEAGVHWQMPDGPCWCETERRKNWQTKIHTRFCLLARALAAREGGGDD